MDPISKVIQQTSRPAKARRSSERSDLIQYFMDTVNRERVRDKRKPLPFLYFARKCTGLELKDLYYLKSICEDADRRGGWKDKDGKWHPTSFGKLFCGSLKAKTSEL